ncbi:MAG: radical SAM protein, partial [Lachnospiraceae bacterium]|nr:radical SAM protein [Lachnospiraceae bacterium]
MEFSADEFRQLVTDLMPRGSTFKFTGGEPTLNPSLARDLAIAKSLGCTTFLDTNGSSPGIIRKLIQENLVDLFGISLKGLSAEEAVRRSGVNNRKLCWDNVLESIDFIANRSSCDVIVTYVCYEDFS